MNNRQSKGVPKSRLEHVHSTGSKKRKEKTQLVSICKKAKFLFYFSMVVNIAFFTYSLHLSVAVEKDQQGTINSSSANSNNMADEPSAATSISKEVMKGGESFNAQENDFHFVTYGTKRSGSTFQFQVVCLSLYLQINNQYKNQSSELLDKMNCFFVGDRKITSLKDHFKSGAPRVIKTHHDSFYDHIPKESTGIFLSGENKESVRRLSKDLTLSGYKVMYEQDLETLAEQGSTMVKEYANLFHLSKEDEEKISKRFRLWDILRMCCGKQMSIKWRNELYPPSKHDPNIPKHPSCSTYDIDAIEQEFIQSDFYKELEQHPTLRKLNKPAIIDGKLFGRYCSSYNDLVRTKGVGMDRGVVKVPDDIKNVD